MATDFKCNLPFLAFNSVNTNQPLCTNQSDVAGTVVDLSYFYSKCKLHIQLRITETFVKVVEFEKELSCLPTCSSLSYIGNIDYVTENGG